MKRLPKAIIPTVFIVAVWFIIFLAHFSSLAINHFIHIADARPLPVATSWLILATRYYIIHATGLILTALVIFAGIRNNKGLLNALSCFIFAGIAFVLLGVAAFTISIGACMCDEWKQWKQHGIQQSPESYFRKSNTTS